MLRTLIHRPIAVTMVLIALVAVGILALTYIPVSLMPEIDIPRITVQMSNPGASVSEVEQQMVTPMRYQLSQVAGLKDIETVSRMDAGTITLYFEPGTDMDLLFIDVNEKIDRAMNSMPKDMERPKVVKASAMDIPAFYVDVVEQEGNIASLSKLVRNVIAKRIEQLPQTAMVDYSGTVGTELLCIPDLNKLESLGLSTRTIEAAINDNNIVLEALSVRDGIYRYSIHFDSQILGKEDIENIYLRHEGRMLQDFRTAVDTYGYELFFYFGPYEATQDIALQKKYYEGAKLALLELTEHDEKSRALLNDYEPAAYVDWYHDQSNQELEKKAVETEKIERKLLKRYGYDIFGGLFDIAKDADYSLAAAVFFNPYYSLSDWLRFRFEDYDHETVERLSAGFSLCEITSFEMPVYVLQGDQDSHCGADQRFIEQLNAPDKGIRIIKGGHSSTLLQSEELAAFIHEIAEKQKNR